MQWFAVLQFSGLNNALPCQNYISVTQRHHLASSLHRQCFVYGTWPWSQNPNNLCQLAGGQSDWDGYEGVCDEDIGMCFCNGTFGRIPAPLGSKPGKFDCLSLYFLLQSGRRPRSQSIPICILHVKSLLVASGASEPPPKPRSCSKLV